jgi:hypothetical protein
MRKISSKHLILVFITSLEYPAQKVSSAALIDALAEYPKSAPAHLTVSPWEPSAISDRADFLACWNAVEALTARQSRALGKEFNEKIGRPQRAQDRDSCKRYRFSE